MAAPTRWPNPRGPASGGGLSAARPIVGDIELAWTLSLSPKDGAIVCPPVLWDGVGYFLTKNPKGLTSLIAFDVRSGKRRAATTFTDKKIRIRSRLIVMAGIVVLESVDRELVGYRLRGSKMSRAWRVSKRHVDGSTPTMPIGEDGLVYVPARGSEEIFAFRPGSSFPLWSTGAGRDVFHRTMGAPVVAGDYVFQARGNNRSVSVTAYHRSNGELKFHQIMGYLGKGGNWRPRPIQLTVTRDSLYLRSSSPLQTTKGNAYWSMQELTWKGNAVELKGKVGLLPEVPVAPVYHRRGTLILEDRPPNRAWSFMRDRKIYALTDVKIQPDLFRHTVAPTLLGDIGYFGSWAADLESLEILWRLPVKSVVYRPVPTDNLVLIVDGVFTIKAFQGAAQ